MRTLLVFALLGAAMAAASGQARYRHDGAAPLPDGRYTPGQADPALTKAALCAPGFRTGPYRRVDEELKKKACVEYGVTKGCPGRGYEIDHLISLELGGSDALANLWPEPAPSYHEKDKLENALHRDVCAGRMGLADAQRCIAGDWVRCARAEARLK